MDSLQAQENLRDVKHRPLTKAFPVMCSDEKQIKEIAEVNERTEKLIAAFMPGPVTFILTRKESVPAFVNGGMPTLAVRMAVSKPLEELISAVGGPIFMTSANQSGEPTCTSLDEIEKACPDLNGMMEGTVTFGEASTIIDCTQSEVKILRKGPVTEEQIINALK
jgi:L-threonylcarbamoyladenylate synthase